MSDSDTVPESTTKKRRLQNACDECRRRKIRCDSATMPDSVCSNCHDFRLECLHTFVRKRRGPQPGRPQPKKSTDSSIDILVTAILSPTSVFVIPSEPSEIRKLLISLAKHVRHLEAKLSQSHSGESSSGTNDPSPSTNDSDPRATGTPGLDFGTEVEQLTEQIEQLQLSQARGRYFGKLSRIMQVQTAVEIKKNGLIDESVKIPSKMKRPTIWSIFPWQRLPELTLPELIFPPEDLMANLIDLYFLHMNPFLPLLHRPTFEKSVNDGLHYRDRQFGETLLVVCAIASRHSDDPRNLPGGLNHEELEGSPEHAFGWRWYRQVTQMPTSESLLAPPSLYEVQKYILSIYFLQASSTPEAAWVMVSVGVRLAQDVGAHRKQKDGSLPTVERELWRRAFWLLVATDILISAFIGRPRAMTSDDFDAELPTECDDEYWEHSNPDLTFKQPEGKPSVMTYWICMLKLLDILAFAQRTIYSTRNSVYFSDLERSQKVVRNIDAALNRWITTLPDHLKWDPHRKDDLFFSQSVTLYATYYWIQMQVHRLYIARPGRSSILGFPSLAICANAARSCSRMINPDADYQGFLPLPNVLTAVFSAAIVLMVNKWRIKQLRGNIDDQNEVELVRRCIALLRKHEKRYQTAGRFHDILNEVNSTNLVLEASAVPRASSESLTRKRARETSENVSQTSTPRIIPPHLIRESESVRLGPQTQNVQPEPSQLPDTQINPVLPGTSEPSQSLGPLILFASPDDLPLHDSLRSSRVLSEYDHWISSTATWQTSSQAEEHSAISSTEPIHSELDPGQYRCMAPSVVTVQGNQPDDSSDMIMNGHGHGQGFGSSSLSDVDDAVWQDMQGDLIFGSRDEGDWVTFMASIDEMLRSHR